MRNHGRVNQAAVELAMWPVIIGLSPAILVAGEPVNRYVMRRVRRSAPMAQVVVLRRRDDPSEVPGVTPVHLTLPFSLLLMAISNPLWIALTAPGRWMADRISTLPSPNS